MDHFDLGYFVYMSELEEDEEEIEAAEVGEYKVNSNDDLEAD